MLLLIADHVTLSLSPTSGFIQCQSSLNPLEQKFLPEQQAVWYSILEFWVHVFPQIFLSSRKHDMDTLINFLSVTGEEKKSLLQYTILQYTILPLFSGKPIITMAGEYVWGKACRNILAKGQATQW